MISAVCAPITSGGGFLKGTLAYFDCAGQQIGAFGYQALAAPGSPVSQIMLALITLFIAWFGIRMMFGRTPDIGGVVLAAAKIGLVLMLMTSWPAVRTLVFDPSFDGPAELVGQANGPQSERLEDRLQRVDDGIVALTSWGTGKLDIRAGRTADGQPAASAFSGIALTDSLAFGAARLSYLVATLMTFGLLRLLGGVMIAALPLFAGLLLFEATRGLFDGWARLLFALFVCSFSVPLILSVELALLEPWLAQAIAQRGAYFATPSAPTELLAMTASFFLILAGSTALIVRACFSADLARVRQAVDRWRTAGPEPIAADAARERRIEWASTTTSPRAQSLAQYLEVVSRQSPATAGGRLMNPGRVANDSGPGEPGAGRIESGHRRAAPRNARSSLKRDRL